MTLSTTDHNLVGDIKVRQADDETQVFEVNIIENGVIKSFNGLTPFFCLMAREITGQGVSEEPVKVFDAVNGTLKYTLSANAMQMVGRNEAYFSFRKESSSGRWVEQFSTKSFFYTVEKSIYTQPFKDSNYWFTFNELYQKFLNYQENGKVSWEDFVKSNKEIIEDVDPGGKLLSEIISSRQGHISLQDRLASIVNQNLKLGNTYKANSKGFLKIPVYNSSTDYQATHPSVLFFANKFNGYKYWMAFTPYAYENESLENPCIVASDDGLSWVVPAGLSNPLAKTDNANNMHYSDTHLVHVDGKLEIWYRKKLRGINPSQEFIVRKISADGVTWSEEEVLYSRLSGAELLCPVVIYADNKYCIWIDNYFNNKFEYFESADGKNWNKVRDINFPKHPLNYKPWHFDIKLTSAGYEMYYSASNGDYNGITIAYAVSQDNVTYNYVDDVIKKMPQNIDETRTYRPCIVDSYGKRFLYYGGTNESNQWYIGLSTGRTNAPTDFYGFDFTNMLPFYGQGFYGIKFPNGLDTPNIKTNEISIGTYGSIKEKELKLVDPNISEAKLVVDASLKNVFHVKTGSSYSGFVSDTISFWDTTLQSLKNNLRVRNGVLQYFDGNYYQRVALNVAGNTTDRPKTPYVGQNYYDTTIGKPIWYGGSAWIDATGRVV